MTPSPTGERMSAKVSAGFLYRVDTGLITVLLVHPGGPFWKNKDARLVDPQRRVRTG